MPRKPTCLCGDCKKCKHRAYMKKWYHNMSLDERRAWWKKRDPERVRAWDAARYYRDYDKRRELMKRIAGKYDHSAAKDAWRKRNKDKAIAHGRLHYAIRTGKMEKGTCEDAWMGECTDLIQAHHEDYSKPLDVTWLCSRHHGMRHRRRIAA